MTTKSEIFIVPFFGQGHLFPSMELCKHLASRNYITTLVIASNLSSSIPSSLRQVPLVQVAEIESDSSSTHPPPPPPQPQSSGSDDPVPPHHRKHHQQMGQGIEALLSSRFQIPNSTRPVCAILDNMMSWSKEIFAKFDIPTVAFFTSGACNAAIEYASWKNDIQDIKPGELRLLPGLPDEMGVTYSDLKRQSRERGPPGGPPGPPSGPGFGGPPSGPGFGGPPSEPGFGGPPAGDGPRKFGPPKPGQRPRWLDEADGSIAIMINTCDELEHPFIHYLATQIEKPVWGVGPLLPEQYWKSAGTLIHDREIRSNRQSNYTEDEVMEWLDSKPRGTVIYVSFGSEVGPTLEEYGELAEALEESKWPFIWVLQPGSGRSGPPPGIMGGKPDSDTKEEEGYFPHGLETKVGKRGLIIRGWAPQLLILSHESTGGFLSHCGWNSTVEGIGRGVPILAWPIRGDQFCDAKLVVTHLKMGYMVGDDDDESEMIKKEEIVKGIEKLMSDEEVKKRAKMIGAKFGNGFPASSVACLDAFRDFINQKLA